MFNSIMHVSFFTDKIDEMIKFYTDILGGKIKSITRYEVYKDRDDRPEKQKIAKEDPNRIFNVYIEIAPMEFIELFPANENQLDYISFNSHKGYSHFALTVDDIFDTRKILEDRGLTFDTPITKGPSETYQMWAHDPDGNKFEIMQFTNKSLQIIGNV